MSSAQTTKAFMPFTLLSSIRYTVVSGEFVRLSYSFATRMLNSQPIIIINSQPIILNKHSASEHQIN